MFKRFKTVPGIVRRRLGDVFPRVVQTEITARRDHANHLTVGG
jgi:hypothetical protein